jgi:hypothetical protein
MLEWLLESSCRWHMKELPRMWVQQATCLYMSLMGVSVDVGGI